MTLVSHILDCVFSGLSETEPAVDLPLQFNFGSPYRCSKTFNIDLTELPPSSSLVVFFDFEHNKNELEGKGVKICDRKT